MKKNAVLKRLQSRKRKVIASLFVAKPPDGMSKKAAAAVIKPPSGGQTMP